MCDLTRATESALILIIQEVCAMTLDLIITTHNRVGLLTKCLASVEAARLPAHLSITVFVVDNRSSDNTREAVLAFRGRTHLHVEYIHTTRPGKSASLNDAIPRTEAELLGFIDDDETLDPTWFEVVEREFMQGHSIDFVGGPYLPDWEHSPPDWLPENFRGAVGIVPRVHRVEFSRDFEGILMGGNAVIRRRALERVLPYPEKLGKIGGTIRSGEDEVIYHRLLAIDAKGVVVPDLIVQHWISAERMTKRHYRRWTLGRGVSVGMQLRERGFRDPALLGIPRYYWGAMIRSILPSIFSRSEKNRLSAQLRILDCFGTLYGRHLYR